jgi:hypothetical protein
MVVNRQTYELMSLKTVLQLDTHLSFPFIIRENGRVFFCPENTEGNEWALYEYDEDKEDCRKVKVLSNRSLADAVVFKRWGRQLMTATTYPNDNGNQIDIYELNETDGGYHHVQSYEFSENIGRNAGDVFEFDGTLYRPAQECGLCYGHAVSIQEITNDGEKYSLKEICRLKSPDKYRILGIHTLNSYKGVVVSDATVYHHPLWGSLLYYVKEVLSNR